MEFETNIENDEQVAEAERIAIEAANAAAEATKSFSYTHADGHVATVGSAEELEGAKCPFPLEMRQRMMELAQRGEQLAAPVQTDNASEKTIADADNTTKNSATKNSSETAVSDAEPSLPIEHNVVAEKPNVDPIEAAEDFTRQAANPIIETQTNSLESTSAMDAQLAAQQDQLRRQAAVAETQTIALSQSEATVVASVTESTAAPAVIKTAQEQTDNQIATPATVNAGPSNLVEQTNNRLALPNEPLEFTVNPADVLAASVVSISERTMYETRESTVELAASEIANEENQSAVVTIEQIVGIVTAETQRHLPLLELPTPSSDSVEVPEALTPMLTADLEVVALPQDDRMPNLLMLLPETIQTGVRAVQQEAEASNDFTDRILLSNLLQTMLAAADKITEFTDGKDLKSQTITAQAEQLLLDCYSQLCAAFESTGARNSATKLEYQAFVARLQRLAKQRPNGSNKAMQFDNGMHEQKQFSILQLAQYAAKSLHDELHGTLGHLGVHGSFALAA